MIPRQLLASAARLLRFGWWTTCLTGVIDSSIGWLIPLRFNGNINGNINGKILSRNIMGIPTWLTMGLLDVAPGIVSSDL